MCPARTEGFTLGEILVVVAITAVIAAVGYPMLSSQHARSLQVAARETGNALRFAVNEARRTGGYILVDAKTSPGRLKVFASDATGTNLGAVNDPVTKQPLDINPALSAFFGTVGISAKFKAGGEEYAQLLIGPATQLQAFDGPGNNKGLLQSGSGIVLALGKSSVTVTIQESTGFVVIP